MTTYLKFDQLIAIHAAMINRYGGLTGLRDKNFLL
jgi:prophage maintenance system killer protein